jgi:hypothetical protein
MKDIIATIVLIIISGSPFIYYFIKEKRKKNKINYIRDIAVNCLKDKELISIVSNGDRSPKDRDLADKEIRRRNIKL